MDHILPGWTSGRQPPDEPQRPDWAMWRKARDFSRCFSAHFEANGHIIQGRWEKSTDDGRTWQHNFNLDYIRLEPS